MDESMLLVCIVALTLYFALTCHSFLFFFFLFCAKFILFFFSFLQKASSSLHIQNIIFEEFFYEILIQIYSKRGLENTEIYYCWVHSIAIFKFTLKTESKKKRKTHFDPIKFNKVSCLKLEFVENRFYFCQNQKKHTHTQNLSKIFC